jgi:hypothetical protein
LTTEGLSVLNIQIRIFCLSNKISEIQPKLKDLQDLFKPMPLTSEEIALYKRLMIDEYESAPTVVHGALADKIPTGNALDYLPEVDEIINKVVELNDCYN